MFSSEVVITYSGCDHPRHVIKVFFQNKVTKSDDIKELPVDEDILTELKANLEDIRTKMIDSTRMGEWEIGYLARS